MHQLLLRVQPSDAMPLEPTLIRQTAQFFESALPKLDAFPLRDSFPLTRAGAAKFAGILRAYYENSTMQNRW